jgi:hypothetical protein
MVPTMMKFYLNDCSGDLAGEVTVTSADGILMLGKVAPRSAFLLV